MHQKFLVIKNHQYKNNKSIIVERCYQIKGNFCKSLLRFLQIKSIKNHIMRQKISKKYQHDNKLDIN